MTIAKTTRDSGPLGYERPLLAPWFRVVEAGDRLLLEHAGKLVELRGAAVRALLPRLIPLLDGAHTVPEIVERLGETAEEPVSKALALLGAHGLLRDGAAIGGNDVTAWYVATSSPGATPASASESLVGSRVLVSGSSWVATETARLLAVSDVDVVVAPFTVEAGSADLVVAAPAPCEVAELRKANEHRLRDGVPWLAVWPDDGRCTAVGPLHVPGQTACHECYLLRRAATSGYESDFRLVEARPVAAPMPDAIGAIASGLAALICIRWLGARDATLTGVLFAFEANGTPGLTRHRMLRVPRCSACGVSVPPPNPWFKRFGA